MWRAATADPVTPPPAPTREWFTRPNDDSSLPWPRAPLGGDGDGGQLGGRLVRSHGGHGRPSDATTATTATTSVSPTTVGTAAAAGAVTSTSTTVQPPPPTTAAPSTTTTAAPATTTTAVPVVRAVTTTTTAPTTTTTWRARRRPPSRRRQRPWPRRPHPAPAADHDNANTTAPTTTTTAPTTTTGRHPPLRHLRPRRRAHHGYALHGYATTATPPRLHATTAPLTTPATASTPVAARRRGPTPSSDFPSSVFDRIVQGWPVDPQFGRLVNDFVTDYRTTMGPSCQLECLSTASLQPGRSQHLGLLGVQQLPVEHGQRDSDCRRTPAKWVLGQPSYRMAAFDPDRLGTMAGVQRSAAAFRHAGAASWTWLRLTGLPPTLGLSATGISYLATTVTERRGVGSINHAIAVTLPTCSGYVYPADRGDCTGASGQPAEANGSASGDVAMPSGLSPFAQMVFRALQNYGAVVTDAEARCRSRASRPATGRRRPLRDRPHHGQLGRQQEYQVVASLPWNDLQVVDPPQ